MTIWNDPLPRIIEDLYCAGPGRLGSKTRPFTAADVGNVLFVHEGPGFDRAHYVIQAVEDGCAVVDHRYAVPDAVGGVATLGGV
jgi:hypothetical protein